MGEPGVGVQHVDPHEPGLGQSGQAGPFSCLVLHEVDLDRQTVGHRDAGRLTVYEQAHPGRVAVGDRPLHEGDDRLELGRERPLGLEQLGHSSELLDGVRREVFHPGLLA